MKEAARNISKLSKVIEVIKESQASPIGFTKGLCDPHLMFTPITLKGPEKQQATSIGFVMQSSPHIRKKPLKLEWFEDRNGSQLLEIDQKVNNNHDSAGKRCKTKD